MLNISLIGCGKISPSHYKSINKLKFGKVQSLIDVNKKHLMHKANKWKINNFSDDLDYLEEVVKPDVIHICTPPQYHYEIIKRFYKKRIGIFVEKPFVLKKTEINDVIKNSSPKCLISCNHNYVYKKSIQRLLNFTTENNIRPKQRI